MPFLVAGRLHLRSPHQMASFLRLRCRYVCSAPPGSSSFFEQPISLRWANEFRPLRGLIGYASGRVYGVVMAVRTLFLAALSLRAAVRRSSPVWSITSARGTEPPESFSD